MNYVSCHCDITEIILKESRKTPFHQSIKFNLQIGTHMGAAPVQFPFLPQALELAPIILYLASS